MISVVIPLHNKEDSIVSTIKSVLSQTYRNFEIIIINDGSTDDSEQKVLSINDERIKLFTVPNHGVAAARNLGVEKSSFNLIALLDADDVWEDTFLEEMIGFISEYPNASLYGCGYFFQLSEHEFQTPNLGLQKEGKLYIEDYFFLAQNNTLFTSSSAIFRKQDFIEIGRYDTQFSKGEDIDLWIRFGLFKTMAFYNKPLAVYRWHAENRAMNKTISKEKCLIWNLNKYTDFESSNKLFKNFLDKWRFAHIANYMNGNRTEVNEITPLLKSVDLNNYSFVWKIIRYSPQLWQKSIFVVWQFIRKIK